MAEHMGRARGDLHVLYRCVLGVSANAALANSKNQTNPWAMIFYFLIAMIAEVFTLALYLFPSAESFFPLPDGVMTSFYEVGEKANYFLNLAGDDVGDALRDCIGIAVPVMLAIITYRAISNFRVPVISRFTHGQPVKEA